MHKWFIMLLGIFLGSQASAAAQTSATRIVLAEENVAPMMALLETVSAPLLLTSLTTESFAPPF
jgi:hypothetical protein